MKPIGFDYVASPSEFARSKYFYAVVGGFSVTDKQFYFERAYYPAYEILLISSGKGWFRQGQEWVGLIAGDCLVHDMRYPHAYKSDPDHPFQMMYLVFDGHMQDKLWADYFGSPYVLFHPDSLAPLAGVIESILNAMREESDPDETERLTSSFIYQMLLHCLQLSQRGARHAGAAKPDAMIAAQRYLNEHYLTIQSVEEAAKQVNLSYFHFIRQFKRYYGCTPKEYVLLKRVNHAKRMLLLTNRSVTEVADLSGFNHYNSFLHAFRQIERCSPMDYRKNWKMFI